jgi:hypothetical protein
MRPLIMILSLVAVLAAGFWAYRENYATKQVLRTEARLNRDITALNEAIAVQRAEWAYLNRPDRLAELVATNFDRLGLLPMLAEQFATIGHLPDPIPEDMPEGVLSVLNTDEIDDEMLP